MRLNNNLFLLIGSLLISGLVSCSSNQNSKTEESAASLQSQSVSEGSASQIPDPYADILGVYHGVQEAYYMKNQYGDEMIINGNKVPIPAIDYKFLIKEGNKISLQQTGMEDNKRVYYDGEFSVLENTDQQLKIKCNVSDGNGSNPSYILTINKSTFSGLCEGSKFEPSFSISRNTSGSESNPSSESGSAGEEQTMGGQTQDESVDGIYSYDDESASLQITIQGETWIGKTVIHTGMGEENDDVSYENGLVKGNDLYESSGYVEIGHVSGRSLTTSIGNNRVTLTKN